MKDLFTKQLYIVRLLDNILSQIIKPNTREWTMVHAWAPDTAHGTQILCDMAGNLINK